MDDKEKETLIEGFKLLGQHGRQARDEIQAAIDSGEISAVDAGEAQAQVEDLTIPE